MRRRTRCEDIRSIRERRLVHRIGAVDRITLEAIASVMRTFLEI
jgi:hypothetical protein